MASEEKRFAHYAGADQGYAPRGKEFRRELRKLKKQRRKARAGGGGGSMNTRELQRLHYLESLRGDRAMRDTAKVIATIATMGIAAKVGAAAKAGSKLGAWAAKKAAAGALKKKAISKVASAAAKKALEKTFEDKQSNQPVATLGPLTPGVDYSYYGPTQQPEQERARIRFPWSTLRDRQDRQEAGIEDMEEIPTLGVEEISSNLIETLDDTSQEEQFDIIGEVQPLPEMETSPYDFDQDDMFLNPDIPVGPEQGEYAQYEPILGTRPEDSPAPEVLSAMPIQQIPTNITAPSIVGQQFDVPPTQQRSTLEELTTTEYYDLVDKIEAGPTAAIMSESVSDEDLLSMPNPMGMGTYQEMYDEYKANTDLNDDEIMENIRRSATLAGSFGVDIDSVDVEANERERFIKEQTEMHGRPPRNEVVEIHMRNWEKARPERERDARTIAAREQAKALLEEYGIPYNPNEPTPIIPYEKGGKLQHHMGSIKETRKYIKNKYG